MQLTWHLDLVDKVVFNSGLKVKLKLQKTLHNIITKFDIENKVIICSIVYMSALSKVLDHTQRQYQNYCAINLAFKERRA